MAQGTKQRILEAALRLFNQHGTGQISTNHVVDALRMSPGNLYYHYRNKASIIRGLFAQFCEEASRPGVESEEGPPVFQLVAWFERRSMLLGRYEFLAREIFALSEGDSWLRDRFDRLTAADRIQLLHWISAAIDRGAVRPIELETRRALAEALIMRAWFGSLLPRPPKPGPDRAGSYALDLLAVATKQ
jgi:AcrR family transcriptional regulator